jgi:serine/threonine protein phosphatase PrpC
MTDASDTTAAPKEPETTASPAATGEAEPSSGPSAAADAAAPSIEISNESSAAPAPATAVETAPVGTPVVSSGPVEVRLFGRTDVGMIREHNEDNFLIADLTQRLRNVKPEIRTHTVGSGGTLFAVCDGMGGAAAGEVASQMAVDTIYDLMQNSGEPRSKDQFARRISESIGEAGARIYLAAKTNRAQRGMGTTSTVAGVYDKTLFLGQVGDSRAYLVRAGKIKQLTKDQSLVAKLIEAGQLTEAEAENYEHGHIILQALGTSDSVAVDLSFIDLRDGDVLMVCSDGLCGLVNSGQMLEVLTTSEEPMDCCKRLTDLANSAGGHDNITVIVVRFGGGLPKLEPGDEVFGYQPWILSDEPHNDGDAKVASRIKGADAPPPGKDVKNAVSIRPPAPAAPDAVAPAGRDKRPAQRAGDDEEITLPVSNGPRYALVAFLLALAVGLLLAALYLIK